VLADMMTVCKGNPLRKMEMNIFHLSLGYDARSFFTESFSMFGAS
jgi:hypothetical protein